MAGIFPGTGDAPADAVNGVDVATTDSANERFYANDPNCPPRLDAAAQNALISEILNVVEASGVPYEATRLDNLVQAILLLISADATTAQDGVVEIATAQEICDAAALGSTGAPIVVTPALLAAVAALTNPPEDGVDRVLFHDVSENQMKWATVEAIQDFGGVTTHYAIQV